MNWLKKYEGHLFALLRIVSGLMFAMHGTQKLFNFPPSDHPGMAIASMGGLSGLIELVAGLLIAIGLFTGFAAFIASGEMAVGYFMMHFPKGFWPIQNKGELAVLYCFLFLYMAARGSGPLSIDAARK
ncbi:MAG TPA: DoxX family protein [Thermoanaerobaculia bacterium]|nr:DoxX family protein [Thermoanaerobaculia bacterium]